MIRNLNNDFSKTPVFSETASRTSAPLLPRCSQLRTPEVPSLDVAIAQPLVTIFAVPKPFVGSANLIQRNAIRSWSRLSPQVEVLLIGDEEGIAEAAAELGVRHLGGLKFNSQGTPLISSAFEIAHRESSSPVLMYSNSDVIFLKSFLRTMERLAEASLPEFVAFGRRVDLTIEQELHFENRLELESLLDRCRSVGQSSSIVCKEYFAFSRHLYPHIPEFAVGRGNWDNWMIHSAKRRHVPVIDISAMTMAIHQTHDYSHVGKSRWKCYVGGAEARENQRLAGGRHLVAGSTPNWRLDEQGLRKVWLSSLNLSFWTDLPRFLVLMKKLLVGS